MPFPLSQLVIAVLEIRSFIRLYHLHKRLTARKTRFILYYRFPPAVDIVMIPRCSFKDYISALGRML